MLENIASLPQKLGGSISWFPGHEPTKTSSTHATSSTSARTTHSSMSVSYTRTESSLSASPTSPTLSMATATTPATAHADGLGAGAKAGIAIGSVLGALLIAFLVRLAILARKRRISKANPSVQPFLPTTEPGPVQPDPSAPTFSALGGFKAELPAEEPPSANSLAPSSIPNSPSPAQSPRQSPALSMTPNQYQPYRPGVYANSRHSNVSQLSSQNQGYSESLASASTPRVPEDPRVGAAGRGYPRSGQPDTIHELQG